MNRLLFWLVPARHKVTPALDLLTQSRYCGQLLWRSPHISPKGAGHGATM